MREFTKTFASPEQLVELLVQRGLIITDKERAARYLQNIGYYRLSAYMYPLLERPKTEHHYKEGATFDKVLYLYRFDKKLRILLFNEIEKIEVAFRTRLSNVVSFLTGDIFWITNPKYIDTKSLSLIKKEYEHSTEDFITHFKGSYSNPFPPSWVISEILSLGTILWIYKHLPKRIMKQVAKSFQLQAPIFESWINIITLTRNSCCHHSRIWNKHNPITPSNITGTGADIINPIPDPRRIYYNICIIKYFLNIISPNNDFKNKLTSLLAQFPEIDILAMGFNLQWQDEKLWVS